MCWPAATRAPWGTRLLTGSSDTLSPVSVVIVRTPRSTTVPAKLITPDTGATTRVVSAARSRPLCPAPHGVAGAKKSRRIVGGPETGHTHVGAGAGGNNRLRVSITMARKVTVEDFHFLPEAVRSGGASAHNRDIVGVVDKR